MVYFKLKWTLCIYDVLHSKNFDKEIIVLSHCFQYTSLVALFPGHSHLQYLIVCSIPLWRGKAWPNLPDPPPMYLNTASNQIPEVGTAWGRGYTSGIGWVWKEISTIIQGLTCSHRIRIFHGVARALSLVSQRASPKHLRRCSGSRWTLLWSWPSAVYLLPSEIGQDTLHRSGPAMSWKCPSCREPSCSVRRMWHALIPRPS